MTKTQVKTMQSTPISNIDEEEFQIRLNRLRNFKNLPTLEEQSYNKDSNTLSTGLWNLDKKQDWTWCSYINNTMFSIVVDGHGDDTVINWFKSKPNDFWLHICKDMAPLRELEETLLTEINSYSSGACITLVRTNMETNAEIFYLGDAVTQVYINGTKATQTTSHTWENEDEKKRKIKECALFTSEMMLTRLPELTDNNPHMTMAKGQRCLHTPSDYNGGDSLQITRALGHNGTTGKNYGYLSVDFNKTDDVKIISASDGVFDVIHTIESLAEINNASELVMLAAQRWCGDWNYVHNKGHNCLRCRQNKNDEPVITIQKGIKPDDISACVIHLSKE